MQKIVIIGAGVSGLGCAIRIKERFPSSQVTIISKNFSPNTTGDGSAGLWLPYLVGNTSEEKISKWSHENYNFFLSLWQEGLAGSCLIPCLCLNKEETSLPKWKDFVLGFENLKGKQLEFWKSTLSLDLKSVQQFMTFTCEPSLLLAYLTDRFLKIGGKMNQREVENIEDIMDEQYDVIINCTGLNAKYIVPDDSMYPIRGQISRVRTPWVYHTILDDSDDGNYVIPNTKTCVLGGTHQVNNFNLKVDPEDTKFIRKGCERMIPGLKNQQNIFEWVGLRPGRKSVRLDFEKKYNPQTGWSTLLIHNYGHGGSGVTLFWGCAAEVVEILETASRNSSKL